MTDTSQGENVAHCGVCAAITAHRDSLGDALNDPDSETIRESLTRSCDICDQPVGALCVKRKGITADLAGRLVHLGRLTPRGRAK